MANRWFRLQEIGTGGFDDEYRPDFSGHDVDGWTGNKSHPDGSPRWIVRVYADTATLDALAGEPSAQELSGVPTQALNNMLGANRTADEWKQNFRVK